MGMGDRAVGPDRAIAADPDARPDHGMGANQCPGADHRQWSDHREWIHRDVSRQFAEGCTMAPGETPRCRTRKPGAARAVDLARDRTKASYGLRLRKTVPIGRMAHKAVGSARPGRSTSTPRRLASTRRSSRRRPRVSTGAMPVRRRERSAPSHGSAPVSAATSATLNLPRAKKIEFDHSPPPQAESR